jgi:hypothetical protein
MEIIPIVSEFFKPDPLESTPPQENDIFVVHLSHSHPIITFRNIHKRHIPDNLNIQLRPVIFSDFVCFLNNYLINQQGDIRVCQYPLLNNFFQQIYALNDVQIGIDNLFIF